MKTSDALNNELSRYVPLLSLFKTLLRFSIIEADGYVDEMEKYYTV